MAFLAAPALALFVLLVHPRTLLNWKLYLAAVIATFVPPPTSPRTSAVVVREANAAYLEDGVAVPLGVVGGLVLAGLATLLVDRAAEPHT